MYKNINKGFTLIELLIVIAIIGVLAATVVVSLGDQAENAREGSVKIGVAAVASLARIEVDTNIADFSGTELCEALLPNVAGEGKATWVWTGSDICKANDAKAAGDICCSSDKNDWIVWGNISGDGSAAGQEAYCAHSVGDETYRGKITFVADNASASTKLTDGGATDTPKSCI